MSETPDAAETKPASPKGRAKQGQRVPTQASSNVVDGSTMWIPLEALRPWAKNPRVNDGEPVERVAESLRAFGFVNPIVIWRGGDRMVAGHTRLKALRHILGQPEALDDAGNVIAGPRFVPRGAPGPGLARVLFHEFKDEKEADLYALADNKLGELAQWDDAGVEAILANYTAEEVSLAGFGEDIALPPEPELEADDDVPDLPAEPITRAGDLWLLGEHRLLCGDATKAEDVARLMGGARADLLWTDPPYNVAYVGKTKDALTIQNDKMGAEEFRAFLRRALGNAHDASRPGACWYVASPPGPVVQDFGEVLRELGVWRQTLVWLKNVFVMGHSDYHYRHETLFYGWKAGADHRVPMKADGKTEDRAQDSIWEVARPGRSTEHPTMKPVALVERAIANSTVAGDKVLDLFGGSGTTLIASAAQGRVAYLLELDPAYCDVIVARWEKASGKKATRAEPPPASP